MWCVGGGGGGVGGQENERNSDILDYENHFFASACFRTGNGDSTDDFSIGWLLHAHPLNPHGQNCVCLYLRPRM